MVDPLLAATDVTRSYDVPGQAVLALRPTSLSDHAADVLVAYKQNGRTSGVAAATGRTRATARGAHRCIGSHTDPSPSCHNDDYCDVCARRPKWVCRVWMGQ